MAGSTTSLLVLLVGPIVVITIAMIAMGRRHSRGTGPIQTTDASGRPVDPRHRYEDGVRGTTAGGG